MSSLRQGKYLSLSYSPPYNLPCGDEEGGREGLEVGFAGERLQGDEAGDAEGLCSATDGGWHRSSGVRERTRQPEAAEAEPRQRRLGVDVKFIPTPSCTFFVENH